jgi:hypothetical protein
VLSCAVLAAFRHRQICRLFIAGFLLFASTQSASATTWKFLVYGDSRSNNTSNPINVPILTELANQTLVENPEFVLFPGDLVYTGGQSVYDTWTNIMRSVYAAGIGVCPVAGNHEANGGTNALSAFKSTFITPYTTAPFAGMTNMVVDNSLFDGRSYSFEFNNAMFLCMDNYSNSSTSAHVVNQTFLDARLAARNPTNTPLVFAMWHEPAFKCGSDTGLENKPTQRNVTWTSIQNAGCRQVFNGHDHSYATARLDDGDGNTNDDTYQVVVGTAGAPLYDVVYSGDTGTWNVVQISSEKQFGFLRVVVDDEAQTVTQTWVHRTGANTYVDTSSVLSYTYTVPEVEPFTAWQMQYFNCAVCPQAAAVVDFDGDGMSNTNEFLAGTDPTNSASAFRITGIAGTGNDVLVTWTMGSGKTNALQATAGDADSSFTNTFADLFTVTNTVGTTTNYLDAGAATNFPSRYYRIRLVP